jgi:transposase
LGSLKESVELQEGLSVGAVWAVSQIGKDLGIEKALGTDVEGTLAFWQVIARVIDQGSRLSAVRLAQMHAACDVLEIRRGFDENDLYDNLAWLADHQERIEQRLFLSRRGKTKPQLFLYDVTSSYLEGEKNYFGEYGYSRDGKKGKKQMVIGLLCDECGDPVAVEVFSGNTQDTRTFASQVRKVAEELGCQEVTFVGDRGMIKSTQIENLPEGFHYITAITKPQIEGLMKRGLIQFGLFDEKVCEVEEAGIRYILRRNRVRVEEMEKSRLSKQRSLEEFVSGKNDYLSEHPRAKVSTALEKVKSKIKLLRQEKWLSVKAHDRQLSVEQDETVLKEETVLDGCYVIKTDLSKEVADKQLVHDRYKDLAEVERAFRDCKTAILEVRPVFVRSEKSTRGHVLVVMLAYMIIRKLREAWAVLDMTVAEGLKQLSTLCSIEIKVRDHGSCLKIPRPREKPRDLLKALGVRTPMVLPHREVRVVTRKKLPEQRRMS